MAVTPLWLHYTSPHGRELLVSRAANLLQQDLGGYTALRSNVLNQDDLLPGEVKLSMYGHDAQGHRATAICDEYISRLKEPVGHMRRLDQSYSEFADCNVSVDQKDEFKTVTERVSDILERFPSAPPVLSTCWSRLLHHELDDYLVPGTARAWKNLQVVQWLDTNTLRLALNLELCGDAGFGDSRTFINRVYQLLEASSRSNPKTLHGLLVQAFLWTAWHRLALLQYAYCLGIHLRRGYNHNWNSNLDLDGVQGIRDAAEHDSFGSKTSGYMCSWAFQTLCSDRASVLMDRPAFFTRLHQVRGHLRPRCILGQTPKTCSVTQPAKCMRFIGQEVPNQSAHAYSCVQGSSCWRLFWDENSYRSHLKGNRAVSLQHTSETRALLQYCPVSSSTMAISHVWSHGQGGRPEQGFNVCLHRRYQNIAKSFGCDSYWMDTPCIPTDRTLRKEAIANINDTFRLSNSTLVCDRDLMDINVTKPSIELLESILAILLVCDWNLRAWTLLEAMRGRKNIYILFEGEHTIGFKDILQQVYSQGSIATAVLFVTAQHLLPITEEISKLRTLQATENRRSKGFIGAEEAGALLGSRHTSRPEDQIVIWSLLVEEKPCYNAREFWISYLASDDASGSHPPRRVSTRFLMSSLPRMREYGFGWAPSRPNVALSKLGGNFLVPTVDTTCFQGQLVDGILRTKWAIVSFAISSRLRLSRFVWSNPEDHTFAKIAHRFLRGYRYGALLRPTFDYSGRYQDPGSPFPGQKNSFWFAVVGSNDVEDPEPYWENGRRIVQWDRMRKWHWRGVYDWTNSATVPALADIEDWVLLV